MLRKNIHYEYDRSCTAIDCCNSITRSCHPSFFISCCLTLVARAKPGNPLWVLRYVSHFAERWVSYIAIVISRYMFTVYLVYVHIRILIYYIYDIYNIVPWSWLKTINPPRRDVIAIFGPLIGSLRICVDDMTWRYSARTRFLSKWIDHLNLHPHHLNVSSILCLKKKIWYFLINYRGVEARGVEKERSFFFGFPLSLGEFSFSSKRSSVLDIRAARENDGESNFRAFPPSNV